MKKECWLIFTALLSTSLLAQQANNPTAPAPIATPEAAPAVTNAASTAAGTNAPAAKAAKAKTKKTAKPATVKKKDPAAELKSVPLVAGPAVVIASKLNVRGRAGLKGEVIGRIAKEQPVTVIEEITLSRSGPDEPSAWAKIMLPTNIHVWVNSSFIEPTNKTVRPKKLNLRGGAGENFSVLGVLKHGDIVKDLSTKGDWMEIEPPADAFAFVAAQYLKQEAPAVVAAAAPTEPAPAPTTVPEPAPIAAATTETPATPPPTTPPPAETPAVTNAAAAETPAVQEPPPPRIVQREGIVRGTFSIQAPTRFELISPDNGRPINYLYTPARDLDLRRYKGLRIIVTGEEGLDERWRNTPIITIQKITVPDTGPQPAG